MRLNGHSFFTAALFAIAAQFSIAGALSAQTVVTDDPYNLYYSAVQANGSFEANAELFRVLPDVEIASHKSTSKAVSSKLQKASTDIWSGTWTAYVDKSDQRMYVYRNGTKVHSWKVSTGKKGYSTPTGSFRANSSRIYKHYTSKKYNAPMPYSVFYYGGFAVHGTYATSRLGSPASHGCVRLSNKNAAKFYRLAKAQRSNLRIKVRN